MKKILLSLLILCACSEKSQEVSYKCDNPDSETKVTVVKAHFYNGGVRLVINGVEENLSQQEAASGARYTTDGIEFWTKGRNATLTTFGASVECVEG